MNRLTTTVVMAGALVAASLVSAAPVKASGPPSGSSVITLRVCNATQVMAQVAISYQPVGAGTFSNAGWYNVAPGQCRDLAQTTNAYMYGYAEVEGSDTDVWQGDHPLCVEYPGPYEFWDNGSAYCEGHQEVRNFVTMHAQNLGVFTWTLNN